MKLQLDKRDDKHFGANYIKISRDVFHRYDGANRMKLEAEMLREFCRDNLKVYRQLQRITSDYQIHYLESKLEEMRISLKILNRLR